MRRKNAVDTHPGTAYKEAFAHKKDPTMAIDAFVLLIELRTLFKDRLKRKTSYGRNEVLEEFDEVLVQVSRARRRGSISDLSPDSTDEVPV